MLDEQEMTMNFEETGEKKVTGEGRGCAGLAQGVNETHKLNETSRKGKGKGMDQKENMEEREKMEAKEFSSRA